MKRKLCTHRRVSVGERRHNETIKLLRKIMSAISDFAAKQKAFNDRQSKAIDSAVESVTALTGDVAELNRIIKELQDSSGEVTPEDLALINELEAQGEATATRAETVAAALKTLDDQTPPAVPVPTP